MLPIQCPRCHEEFDSDTTVKSHLQADVPCQRRDVEPRDGVDNAKMMMLKDRRRFRGLEEEEKWREVYRILFPTDDHTAMPSPRMLLTSKHSFTSELLTGGCLDYHDELPAGGEKPKSSASNEFSPRADYMGQELQRLLRERLDHDVDKLFGSRVLVMVRDAWDEALRRFQRSQGLPDTTPEASSGALMSIPIPDEAEVEIDPTAQDPVAAPPEPQPEFQRPESPDMSWIVDLLAGNTEWDILEDLQRSQALADAVQEEASANLTSTQVLDETAVAIGPAVAPNPAVQDPLAVQNRPPCLIPGFSE